MRLHQTARTSYIYVRNHSDHTIIQLPLFFSKQIFNIAFIYILTKRHAMIEILRLAVASPDEFGSPGTFYFQSVCSLCFKLFFLSVAINAPYTSRLIDVYFQQTAIYSLVISINDHNSCSWEGVCKARTEGTSFDLYLFMSHVGFPVIRSTCFN